MCFPMAPLGRRRALKYLVAAGVPKPLPAEFGRGPERALRRPAELSERKLRQPHRRAMGYLGPLAAAYAGVTRRLTPNLDRRALPTRLPPPSMSTPPVAHTPDVPVPTLCAAHTLDPNLSTKHIRVEPPGIGEDPPLGHLTAGSILRRLDRWLPLRVSDGWHKDQRTPEDRRCRFPHGLLRLSTQELR